MGENSEQKDEPTPQSNPVHVEIVVPNALEGLNFEQMPEDVRNMLETMLSATRESSKNASLAAKKVGTLTISFNEHRERTERTLSHHGMQLQTHQDKISTLDGMKTDIDGIKVDTRETRSDIRQLNTTLNGLHREVISSIKTDTQQERDIGRIRTDVKTMAIKAGGRRGAITAGVVSAVMLIIWFIAYVISYLHGVEPPPLPKL